jgi:hypothetical protein
MLQVLLAFVFCYQALNTHIEAERGGRELDLDTKA